MDPLFGMTIPRIDFIRVVLPDPLGPKTANMPPLEISRSTPESTMFLPNRL